MLTEYTQIRQIKHQFEHEIVSTIEETTIRQQRQGRSKKSARNNNNVYVYGKITDYGTNFTLNTDS
jgi:hypothetical protein